MKNTKRFIAMTAALTLTACMAMPMASFAAATAGKITFTGQSTGHTFNAIKIFTGTATASGFDSAATLTNPKWTCTDSNATSFINALATDPILKTDSSFDFAGCTTAASVANVLKDYENNSAKAKRFAEIVAENKSYFTSTASVMTTGDDSVAEIALSGDTSDGYYVIEDTTSGNGGQKTAYLLGVYDASSGAEVAVKTAAPSFEKKVQDANDSGLASGDESGTWQDSADYDIGDAVPFQLTATLPTDYDTYDHYTLKFTDNMENGKLTFNDASVKVYYIHDSGTKTEIPKTYTPSGGSETANYTLTTASLAAYGSTVGTTSDTTTDFVLQFNDLKNIKDEVGNAIDIDASDKIIVEYNATLATDAVVGQGGNWNSSYITYSNNPYNSGYGADDNTTDDSSKDQVAVFTYKLVVDKFDSNSNALKGAGFTLYKWNDSSEKTDKYVAVGSEVKGADMVEFTWNGLDAGKYKLVETTVPTGFTKCNDLEFVVKAAHDANSDTPSLTALEVYDKDGNNKIDSALGTCTFSATIATGELKTNIVNTSSSALPTTGGIGTTLFILGGGCAAGLAGIYLVSKKKAGKEE